jgi:hypothetical protein
MGVFINFTGFVDIPNVNKANSNVSRSMQSYESKGKAIPLQVLTGPEVSRRLRLPDLKKIVTKKVAKLSALRTGRLYPQEISLVLISVRG